MKRNKHCSIYLKLFGYILALLTPLSIHPESMYCRDIPPLYTLQPSDNLQFGRLWQQIKRLEESGVLYEMALQRREEIHAIKEHWKAKIPSFELISLQRELDFLLETGSLQPSDHGCGAAYFLKDEQGKPLYVIKPLDEDILCLNNRKHFASPYNNRAFRVRAEIPLYRTVQAEALSFAVAHLLGLENQTPPTHLAIISHESFFDITDNLKEEEKSQYLSKMGLPQREKLCSVQTYLAETKNLYDLVEDCLNNNLTDKDILPLIDHASFENLCLLIWLLYDTDAHAGNLYVKKSPQGIYHLLKIDNGLTFPNANSHLLNALYFFPHAKSPLSKRMCTIIENLPIEEIIEKIHLYEMDDALDAFLQRVEILQTLAKDTNYSLREIDMRLHALELPEGTKIALNTELSLEELQRLISYE
ncbi:MAG: hypothetical protein KR126chlam3_00224 [Chlamydiae bacterium]|nr:hypothetical protein [Chlamydiota bacterium]